MMDFHGMKRRKLQMLCKKHGIPANLKNVEMADRLASLFTVKTTPVRFRTMSDILSRCSVIESQREGASSDDGSLVTSEHNTENSTVEEEEMEIREEGCMSVGHCVSNPESDLGMRTEMELLSAKRRGDLSEHDTESSSAEEHADIYKVDRLGVGHCVRETLDEVNALSQLVPVNKAAGSVLEDEAVFTTPERSLKMMQQLSQNGKTLASESVSHSSYEAVESHGVVFTTPEQVLSTGESDALSTSQNEGVSAVVDLHDEPSQLRQSCVGELNGDGLERSEENKTVELHCESGTITTSSNRDALMGNSVSENSGGNKPMEFYEESVVVTGIYNDGKASSLHSQLLHDDSGDKKSVRTAEEAAVKFSEESELEVAPKSEENKAFALQVDCDHFISANKNANCHDVLTASKSQSILGDFEPHTAGKQERDEVESKDESAFFTRFETCLLLGESTQDRPGNSKSFSSHHDSSPKVINDNVVLGSHVPTLDLGENTVAYSSGSIASKFFYSHEFNVGDETAGADFMPKGSQDENVAGLNATQGTSKKIKVNSPHVYSVTDTKGGDTIMKCNPVSELFVETIPSPSMVQLEVSLPTGPILVKETDATLTDGDDAKNNVESVLKEHSFVAKLAEADAVLENSAVHLTLPLNNAASSVLDESAVFTTPERNLMMLEQLSQNEERLADDSVNHHGDEAVESHAVVFTTPEQVLLLSDYGIEEVGKQVDCDNFTGANITAKSHDMSDVLAASESQSFMGDFEPFTAKKQEREGVEFKDESALFTWFETCLLLGESAHDNIKSGSSHHDSSAKVILKNYNMVRGSHVPALHLGDNTVPDSSGEETAGADLISKGSLAEYVDSANLFDLGIDVGDTTMDAERNVSFSSCVVDGTCSLLPEESSPFTTIHDQINDALEELAITDDLIQTKVTTQRDDMLDSSGGSPGFGKTAA